MTKGERKNSGGGGFLNETVTDPGVPRGGTRRPQIAHREYVHLFTGIYRRLHRAGRDNKTGFSKAIAKMCLINCNRDVKKINPKKRMLIVFDLIYMQ